MTTAIKINQNDGKTLNVMTGGETSATFDFPIYDATHLAVYKTDTSGNITVLVKDTDYTVPAGSVNQQAGGTITLTVAAVATEVYTIYLDAPEERTTDFTQAGDFFADTLNRELDLLTQQMQQFRRDINRAALAPVDTTLTALTLPDPVDNYFFAWNGTSGDIKAVVPSSIGLSSLDTLLTSLANGDYLQYNSSGAVWENKTSAQVTADVFDISRLTNMGGTFPATADLVAVYDQTDTTNKYITAENFLRIVNGLTADGSPDTAADYILTYDTSASGAKKVLIDDILPVAATTTTAGLVEVATEAEAKVNTTNVFADCNKARHMPGHAKAWVNFNGNGTVSIHDSHNITSVTDNGTADYTLNFTENMANDDYVFSMAGTNNYDNTGNDVTVALTTTSYMTTSSLRFISKRLAGGGTMDHQDIHRIYVTIHGELS